MKNLPVMTKILPQQLRDNVLWIACSGGIDSMFAAEYFRKTRSIGLLYFNHGTEYANAAEQHVRNYAYENCIPFMCGYLLEDLPKGRSKEDWWREKRYEFLNSSKGPVVTGHHLDDAVETWVWGSCHGQPKLPSLVNKNIYRPFLACKKAAMREFLDQRGVGWIEDPSNTNTAYIRNHIRANVIPELYKVNPGLDTVVQKKVQEQLTSCLLK